jgi:hypothetical protein
MRALGDIEGRNTRGETFVIIRNGFWRMGYPLTFELHWWYSIRHPRGSSTLISDVPYSTEAAEDTKIKFEVRHYLLSEQKTHVAIRLEAWRGVMRDVPSPPIYIPSAYLVL